MKPNFRSLVALLLCGLLVGLPVGWAKTKNVNPPQPPLAPDVFGPLQQDLQLSYLDSGGRGRCHHDKRHDFKVRVRERWRF